MGVIRQPLCAGLGATSGHLSCGLSTHRNVPQPAHGVCPYRRQPQTTPMLRSGPKRSLLRRWLGATCAATDWLRPGPFMCGRTAKQATASDCHCHCLLSCGQLHHAQCGAGAGHALRVNRSYFLLPQLVLMHLKLEGDM